MADKILVTARSFRQTPGPHQQILIDAGYELVNSPHDRPLEGAELAGLGADVTGMLLGVDQCGAEVFERAAQLKAISRYGVGVDKVDVAAATRHGVVVTITPGANAISVAELALGMMFALARHIPHHDRVVKAGGWGRVSGVELTGATLGVVGLGRIGQEVARRAIGLGMRVLYYDPMPFPLELIASLGVEARSLDALFEESDFISLHLPLTDETHYLIDATALARMKSTACVINTARGGLVDEAALAQALAARQIAGAAADVFNAEPPTDRTLVELDNFIAVPHAGSATLQTTLRMGLMASQNLLAALRGELPEGTVNPEVFERP
ncbi:phosphoglycerate dehydrogenase [Aggregatilinea lenta]|uniref:phosphoglycerate dehydrogenase n=1 Tax=Aggregatilinea lenta TaxID=913108 RepID=UPI000E5C368E|nr:phosphoglycerate dehydrogenase [Aggregatilinea lenta]